MASRLEQVLTDLQSLVTFTSATIDYKFGVRELALTRRMPCVVWVPTHDTYSDPDFTGETPAQLKTRTAGVDAHVWGHDATETESLAHALVAAAVRALGGDGVVVGGEWFTQEAENAGWINAGEVYVLHLTVAIPVTDDTIPTTTITAAALDPSGAVPGDGVLEFGDD